MTSQKFIGTYRNVPNGYGYVTLKGDVNENMVVVSPFAGAFDGDTVEVSVSQSDLKTKNGSSPRRCRIMGVVERARSFIVGEYTVIDRKAYVIPDSYIPFRVQVKPVTNGIKCENGDKVAAVILKYKAISALRVEIVENFGRNDTFGANIKACLYGTSLLSPFGESVEKQISSFREPDISKMLAKRVDLRGKTVFTFADSIFGTSTFAFSLTDEDGIRSVGLHILDVDELVPRYSPLDNEAYDRGRTVRTEREGYPMFPRSFTTSYGSFIEKHASPAVSVFVSFDTDGNVMATEFCESVVDPVLMTSATDIDALFSGIDSSALLPLRQKYGSVFDLIASLYDLSGVLRRARLSKGGVDFDVTERTFGFDSDKRIRHLSLETKSDSFLMVHELLIAIGTAAAEKLHYNGVSCVFTSLSEEPYDIVTGVPSDKVLLPESDYMTPGYTKREASAVKGTGFEKYSYVGISDECSTPRLSFTPYSHFVYSSDIYIDFFHPADRYSSIVNLRAIKSYINDNALDIRQYAKSTDNEIVAGLAERRVKKLMSIGYLEENVGKTYNAVVIKHISGGFRVILDCGIMGFVPFLSVPPSLGKTVRVTVSEADYSTGRIVLNLV